MGRAGSRPDGGDGAGARVRGIRHFAHSHRLHQHGRADGDAVRIVRHAGRNIAAAGGWIGAGVPGLYRAGIGIGHVCRAHPRRAGRG